MTARMDRHMLQLAELEKWRAEVKGAAGMARVVWFALVALGASLYHLVGFLIDYMRRGHS